jgi:tryptophan 7-halogenase
MSTKENNMIKRIVIVGGGLTGWYTACAIQHGVPEVELVVIDSDRIKPLSVGEVTGFDAPMNLDRLCGISDDAHFIGETGAIYKFGVRGIDFFQNNKTHSWGKFPNLKIRSLSKFYDKFDWEDFEEPWNRRPDDIGVFMSWLSLNRNHKSYHDMTLETDERDYFLNNPAAPFDRQNQLILRQGQGLAYHLDATKSGAYFRGLVLYRNTDNRVTWITNEVKQVVLDNDCSENIKQLILEDGTKITADLFVDCTGLSRILMKNSSNTSWSDHGPDYNNAVWFAPSRYQDPAKELIGSSEFCGEDWGWRFKVRLYHRIGNGYVFNTNLCEPEVPLQRLLQVLDGKQLAEPKLMKWDPGQYNQPWQGNLVPMGLAAGFVDPYDAVTFESHNRALDDFIPIIRNWSSEDSPQSKYNEYRNVTVSERNMRLDLTFGVSQRNGPFWDSRREIGRKKDVFNQMRDIVLEKRSDVESRMKWHWHHQYARSCMASGVDMSAWDFPKVSDSDRDMVEAFFTYNRARNKYISQQKWPNYSEWLRVNRFNGRTNAQVLQDLNPHLANNLR